MMKKRHDMLGPLLAVVAAGTIIGGIVARVETVDASAQLAGDQVGTASDRELARLLVKLELKTRSVIAAHYGAADDTHRAWMAKNLLLPAGVADKVFHEVVPGETGGRAWVKMVVDQPRNPHNAADTTAKALLQELRKGKTRAERSTEEAYYYAEPIKAKKTCLTCHGQPKGDPDPFFPQHTKNGWEHGQIVGAVTARVAPGM